MDYTMSTSSPWSLQTQDMLNNKALKIEWNKATNATFLTLLNECTFSIYNAHNDLLAIIKEKLDSTVSYEPDIRLRQVEYVVSTPDGVPMFKIVKVPSKKYWDFAVYTMDGKMVGNVFEKVSIISSAYKLYVFNGVGQRNLFCTFSHSPFKQRFTLRNTSNKPSGVLGLLSNTKDKFIVSLDKNHIKANNLLKDSKILEFSELPHSFGRMAVLIAGVVSYQFNVMMNKINSATTDSTRNHLSIHQNSVMQHDFIHSSHNFSSHDTASYDNSHNTASYDNSCNTASYDNSCNTASYDNSCNTTSF